MLWNHSTRVPNTFYWKLFNLSLLAERMKLKFALCPKSNFLQRDPFQAIIGIWVLLKNLPAASISNKEVKQLLKRLIIDLTIVHLLKVKRAKSHSQVSKWEKKNSSNDYWVSGNIRTICKWNDQI